MSLLRNLWTRVVSFFILRQLKTNPDSPLDFDRLFKEPESWLLFMPAEAVAFDAAMKYCRELLEQIEGVRLHLIVPYEFRHWVRTTQNLKVHPYSHQDLIMKRIPRNSLLRRLRRLEPAIAVDLNPWPTPLSLCICGLCGARVRGAVSRKQGDAVFNFLVKTGSGEIGDQYRALFAYLT
ncbi:hypothetical protein CEE37_13935 [candidate division LCP-89 bacterium B3_LCP]|uniref:Uncharacterized protein n=1 Tax=candidate division LCP-89 bacterium B3_LCP TaxID=2012998 RepID=A0A532URP5_UNCL8|nr:MAG: hypothetical protein CEE37_13935 [candidate division LCP-89 bacterium B3_LCP]